MNGRLHKLPPVHPHSTDPSHSDESFKSILSNLPDNIQRIFVNVQYNEIKDNNIKDLSHCIVHGEVILVSDGAIQRRQVSYAWEIISPNTFVP